MAMPTDMAIAKRPSDSHSVMRANDCRQEYLSILRLAARSLRFFTLPVVEDTFMAQLLYSGTHVQGLSILGGLIATRRTPTHAVGAVIRCNDFSNQWMSHDITL
jgi:hypothetical protein